MNTMTLIHWLDSQSWRWALDMLLHTTVLLMSGLLASVLLRRKSAALAHAVLAGTLMALPLLIALSSLMPRWSVGGPAKDSAPAAAMAQDAWVVKAATTTVNSVKAPAAAALPQAEAAGTAPVASLTLNWPRVIALLWTGGVLLGLGGLGLSMLRLHALERRCRPMSSNREIDAACESLGVSAVSLRLLTCAGPVMPMTWGMLRPRIVLPESSDSWPQVQMLTVIRHELAHIARRDALTNLLVWASAIGVWAHPLVWVALRSASKLREQACDDAATRSLQAEGRQDYAEQLVRTIAEVQNGGMRLPWLPALAMAMASPQAKLVKARLAAVLDDERDRQPMTARGRWGTALTMTALTLLLAGLCACREAAPPVSLARTESGSGEEMRVYFLTDYQWQFLTRSADKVLGIKAQQVVDPFAPAAHGPGAGAGAGEAVATNIPDLPTMALRIRTRLIERGIDLQPRKEGESVVLVNERTLNVWADTKAHEHLARVLASVARERSVFVSGKVLAVPPGAESVARLATALKQASPARYQGTLKSAEGQKWLDELSKVEGASLMSAPSISLAEEKIGTIEVVREFYYPTEFDPPQVPQTAAPGSSEAAHPVITPTTPTAFEMRPIGVRIELLVSAGEEDKIRVEMVPEVTTFEGFVNYGSPIRSPETNAQGKTELVTLTENRLPQPLFSTAKLSCIAQVSDGDWLIVGGLSDPSGADEKTPAEAQPKSAEISVANQANQADLGKLATQQPAKRLIFFALQVTRMKE